MSEANYTLLIRYICLYADYELYQKADQEDTNRSF